MDFLLSNVALPASRDLAAFAPELLAMGAVVLVLVLLLPLVLPKRTRLVPIVTALGGLAAAISAAT
ncbi:MAG: hypothetical protein PHU85_17945, partial [Phycisphaerae bacterium]|nr:hypothetical protein [Phycisphaerae bacterium]